MLRGGAVLVGTLAMPRIALPEETGETPYVYVSPLHPDGSESKCHAEVWYFMDGKDVVLATGKDTWKARALRKGWHGARLWIGDYGRISQAADKLPGAPHFDAKAGWETDAEVFSRLLTAFGEKYPEEWAKWKPRFESGLADGSRLMIRYRATS